jgi:hypothetical protein
MENALHQKRYEVRDVNKFYQAYAKVLLVLPKAQILSTSILDSSYFWSAKGEPYTTIEIKMKNFISNGGKMKRIFYIGENSLNNARNLAVLARQKEIGVDIYTINKATTNKQLFVLFDEANFAWQVQVDPDDKHITKFVFTRNDEDVKQIEDEFSKLMNNATCTPYN